MYLAIAVETKNHPKSQNDYRIWYLEIDERGQVIGVGVKSKDELISHIFDCMKKFGKSLWRAFLKDSESSSPIEIYDFVSMRSEEHTSELQSRENLVCRLLLEKKKKHTKIKECNT